METLRSVAMWVVIGAPIIGLLWTGMSPRLSGRLIGVRLLATAVLLSALVLLVDVAKTGLLIEQSLGTWLTLDSMQRALTVSFGVRFDGLALLQVVWTAAVLLIVVARWPSEISLRWLMLAWFGVTVVVVAGNLGQLFLGWSLSAWASSELARRDDPQGAESPPFRPVWLVQRVSDAMLLIGFSLIWSHLGSWEWSAWTKEAIAQQRPELLSSVALCVLIGVIGRCAQLPLSVWLESETGFAARSNRSVVKLSDEMVGLWNVPDGHHVAERLKIDPANRWHSGDEDAISAAVMGWWLCAAFLPVGIGVLVRFEPLLAVATNTKLLAVAVGAFTLLLCSASAAAQNSWTRVLGQLTVGQCGLTLLTICLEKSDGSTLALFLLLWQSLFLAVLLMASVGSGGHRRSGLITVVTFLLVSGLWGRHAVVDVLWDKAFPASVAVTNTAEANTAVTNTAVTNAAADNGDENNVVLGTTSSGLLPFVVALVCVSELLLSFSLCRAYFLSRREQSLPSPADWWLWLGLIISVVVGTWLGCDPELWNSMLSAGVIAQSTADVATHRAILRFGHLMPLSAIGVVLAWWMYASASALPEKVSAMLGPFARLSRNRFYWNDLYFLLISQPGISLGRWIVWLDEQFWERGRLAFRRGLARFLRESCEPLADGSWSVYALTTFSSAIVLVWMLMWLKSSSLHRRFACGWNERTTQASRLCYGWRLGTNTDVGNLSPADSRSIALVADAVTSARQRVGLAGTAFS
jgi:NADH:ubiquinone oxidoreductase subunit 5 (subunit L)/multisubunit Na+/H+ antiporter MnhA subunit